MSTELIPCPHCNGKALTSDGGFGPVNQDEVLSLHFVECVDCGLMLSADTLDEAIRLWNRRFVCLDKNADKVFSDSKFRYAGGPPLRMLWQSLAWHMLGEGKNKGWARRVYGYMLNNIELIKEEK